MRDGRLRPDRRGLRHRDRPSGVHLAAKEPDQAASTGSVTVAVLRRQEISLATSEADSPSGTRTNLVHATARAHHLVCMTLVADWYRLDDGEGHNACFLGRMQG